MQGRLLLPGANLSLLSQAALPHSPRGMGVPSPFLGDHGPLVLRPLPLELLWTVIHLHDPETKACPCPVPKLPLPPGTREPQGAS